MEAGLYAGPPRGAAGWTEGATQVPGVRVFGRRKGDAARTLPGPGRRRSTPRRGTPTHPQGGTMSVAGAQVLLDRVANDVVFRQSLENAESREEKLRIL